jgi:DmsE family decaheme c-type cytochrome
MKARTYIVLLILAALCISPVQQAQAAKAAKAAKPTDPSNVSYENKESVFHLKPGAAQKVCLTCHPAFEEVLKKKFIHTPVKKPGCAACHNPHTANFPKQLSAEVSTLCLTCHSGMVPKESRSIHKVALEGKCVQCHDPHASDNPNNLLKAGNELCYGCHKQKAEEIKKVKFKHAPVEKGCIGCHNPHASLQAAALLKNEVPALCKQCHDVKKPIFAKAHMNYPVENSACTLCHNVHGSNRSALIYDNAHKPFASKQCNLCHDSATSPKPLTLKKKGFELCRGCHIDVINDMLAKNRLHWPVVGKDGCLNCHNPHATTQAKLLNAAPIKLCGTCHAGTIQRQERSVTKHEPVQEGTCTACHSPHASDNVFLVVQTPTVEFCAMCHDWAKHQTHPVGEKVIDKRNKNLSVDCLSCHRAHGTEFRKMLPFGTISELCTQCHREYQR